MTRREACINKGKRSVDSSGLLKRTLEEKDPSLRSGTSCPEKQEANGVTRSRTHFTKVQTGEGYIGGTNKTRNWILV